MLGKKFTFLRFIWIVSHIFKLTEIVSFLTKTFLIYYPLCLLSPDTAWKASNFIKYYQNSRQQEYKDALVGSRNYSLTKTAQTVINQFCLHHASQRSMQLKQQWVYNLHFGDFYLNNLSKNLLGGHLYCT